MVAFDHNQITGIDVTQNPNLKWLYCSSNQLTTIDVKENTDLEWFSLNNNEITSLNVTQNPNLIWLGCISNQIASLDMAQNPFLRGLSRNNNQLKSLNLTENGYLEQLDCSNNELTNLNIQNGNNEIIEKMWSSENSNLLCIQVDDDSAMFPSCNQTGATGWCKDSISEYRKECTLGLENYNRITFTLYPNPVTHFLQINTQKEVDSVTLHDVNGRLIKTEYAPVVDISELSSGLYFILVHVDGQIETKRFIKP